MRPRRWWDALAIGLVAALNITVGHAGVTEQVTFENINQLIPDHNAAGVRDVRSVTSTIGHITSIQVQLKIVGSFNGDLYAYLAHGNGLTVLLNRPGRTATSSYGYSDHGFDITFADPGSATTDIHNYRTVTIPVAGSPLTGTWQPDARFVDPLLAVDTSPRTTFLSEFNNLDPNGDWVLFLADLDAGATSTLVSWGLTITGTPKILPTITWTNPAPILYGTALDTNQLNASAQIPGRFSYNPPAGTVLDVGKAQPLQVTFAPTQSNDYAVVTTTVALEVQPRPLTAQAADASRVYGAPNPEFSGSLTGQLPTDGLDVRFTTTAGAASPAGSYAIVPTIDDPRGRVGNYALSTQNGALTVTPASLSVWALNQTRAYGAPNPELTWNITGLVNGDTSESALTGSPSLSTAAGPGSAVGDYAITTGPGTLAASNYVFNFADATLSVVPASLTGAADNVSRYYGQTNPVFTVTYTGFANGEDVSVLGGQLTGGSLADTNSPVGVYQVTVQGQTAANYTIQYQPGTLTIEPAPLVVQANDASRAYRQPNPNFSASFLGFANGEDTNVLDGTLVLTTSADTNSPAGTYQIIPSGLTATNYSLIFSNGTLTITPYELVVTIDDQTRNYGTTNAPFTGQLTGVLGGDKVKLNLSTQADETSPVGTYPIVPTLSGPPETLANYSVSVRGGTLTIEPATLTVTANPQTRFYGETNPVFSGTLTGVQLSDSLQAIFSSETGTNSAVGSYPIAIGILDPDGKLPNYNVVTNPAALTIQPALVEARADDQIRPYGSANPLLTGTLTGLQNGDNIQAIFSTLASPTSPAGNYEITIAISDPGNQAGNYKIVQQDGTLRIIPAPLTARADNLTRYYGETNPVFTLSYDGFTNGETPSVLSGTLAFTTAADTNSPAGVYAIVPSGQSDPNYDIVYQSGKLVVLPAPLIVQANDTRRLVGDTNPPFTATFSGFVQGEGPAVLDGALIFATLADTNSPAGSYPIVPSGLSATNYSLEYSNGTLRVCAYSLVVKTDNQKRFYGAPNPELTGALLGVQPGDTITATYSTPADTNSPVGFYPIDVALSDPSGALDNYVIVTNHAVLVVAPAPLVVGADNQRRPYGAPNPGLTGTISGLRNNDGIAPSFSTVAGPGSAVGRYSIDVGLLDPGQRLENYVVTTNTGTLTITPAPLMAVVSDQTRLYGSTNSPITVTYSGFVNGEDAGVLTGTLIGGILGDTNSSVGVYPIWAWGQRASNYSIGYVEGNLWVEPAPLLVQARSASRVYGQTNPVFGATYSGFVNGEDASVLSGMLLVTSLAQPSSQVGDYPILASGLSAENYELDYAPGTLTITPASLIVQADDVTRPYGGSNPNFTIHCQGFVNGDDQTVLGGQLTFTTTVQPDSPVGVYSLLPAGLTSRNYDLVYTAGSLTITPAPLVVQANDASRPYGQTNPQFSVTYTGFVNGDGPAVLSGQLVFTSPAETNSQVGTYPISPSGIGATNYDLAFRDGTLTVTPLPLVASADNQQRPYGAPNPPLTGQLAGLREGENISAVYSTEAATNSPPGDYPIKVSLLDPNNLLSHYVVTTNWGTLTITRAATTALVAALPNPTPAGSPVTLTVEVAPAAPAGGTPGGLAQFKVDGKVYGPSVALTDGRALLGGILLALGAHQVGVQYQGDEDFLPTDGDAASSLMIFSPPVAGDYGVGRAANRGTRIPVAELLKLGQDPNGGTLQIAEVSNPTVRGGTARLMGSWILYEPAKGDNQPDSFTYRLRDEFAESAPATVRVLVNQPDQPALGLQVASNGTNHVAVTGPGWRIYRLDYTDTLTQPVWHALAWTTVGLDGLWVVEDAPPPELRARFYRLAYQFSGESGAVDLSLVSSDNPALPGDPVTFTVEVMPEDPGSAVPSGPVQFLVDDTNYGPAIDLADGAASFTTAALAAGTHTVSAVYQGDTFFSGGKTSLGLPQVINTPPEALVDPALLLRPPGDRTKIPVADLLTNVFDAEGNPLSLLSVSSSSAEGGTVVLRDGTVFYTPPDNFPGGDTFTYSFADSFGATATATVKVEPLLSAGASQTATFLAPTNGIYPIRFTGIPWRAYTIQYSDDPNGTNWVTLGITTADSWGAFEYDDTPPPDSPPRYYRAVSSYASPTASPFRVAVWTNFIAHTNGRSMEIWSDRALPDGWPDVPPVVAWNTNSLLYGLGGFTAISPANEFQINLGQIPVTLLTRRHGYARGHGLSAPGLGTGLKGKRVWFCDADNRVVTMTVAAEITRLGTIDGNYYDYTVVVFSSDVPTNIMPMSVMTAANYETYYSATPDLPFMFFGTEQSGHVSAGVPPFIIDLLKGGDSGSPNMIPSPDKVLIMFSGRTTSSPSPQMQADMDVLSVNAGLDPSLYQLHWYDMKPWGP